VVDAAEGNTDTPVVAWACPPTGIRERGMLTNGLPRNLGDPMGSVAHERVGAAEHLRGSDAARHLRPSSEPRAQQRYRRAKATSEARRHMGSRSAS
jgi:hypothetical protein